MNRSLFSYLMLALLVSIPLSAHASIGFGDLVSDVQNELEDDDFEMLVNAGGTVASPGLDTFINPGDFLAGIFRITSMRVPVGGPQVATATDAEASFTALFLTKVKTVTGNTGAAANGLLDVNFEFEAPTLLDWATIFAPVAGTNIATTAGTVAVFFADPDNMDQTAGLASFATVDGVEAWEWGFKGIAGERWSATADTDNLLDAFSEGVTGAFSANLNVTEQGAGPILTPQLIGAGPNSAQVFLRNGSFGSGAPGANPPFPVSSDVDVLITPRIVPEPISALAWIGLFGAAALGIGRRRVG